MADITGKEDYLAQTLIGMGYDRDSAVKVSEDVLKARAILREAKVREYVGKRVRADFGGLLFDVVVEDIRINQMEKLELLVKPLNGTKTAWISKFSV